jgi:hypothetical protein
MQVDIFTSIYSPLSLFIRCEEKTLVRVDENEIMVSKMTFLLHIEAIT